MHEAVEFIEVWGRASGPAPVPRQRALGTFDTEHEALAVAREARDQFRRSGRREYAWWIVRSPGSQLADWIADSHSDREFVLDLRTGELIEVA